MRFQFLIFLRKNLYLFLIFFTLFVTTQSYNFFFIDLTFYVILHIIFVLCSFYKEFKINYLIVFIIGFVLDIYLVNDFGPHLIVLMFFYLIIKKIGYLFINQTFLALLLINLFFVLIILFLEKFFWFVIYDYKISYSILLQSFVISIILFYPIYLLMDYIKNNK